MGCCFDRISMERRGEKEARFRYAAPTRRAIIHILSGADYGADCGASVSTGVVGPWRNAHE
jgi:hypothetical protein